MKSTSKAVKELIFKNTAELLLTKGVKGWNMNDLAEASGMTKMTLYKIISSKEQLIRDVAFRSIGEMREKIITIINSDSPFPERMEKLINATPEILKENHINNYSEILHEFPELEIDIVKENEKVFTEVRQFYQEGIDLGFIKKDITPELLHHMMQAFAIYFSKYVAAEGNSAERMRTALACIFNGVKQIQD